MARIDLPALERITLGAQALYRQTFEHWAQLGAYGILSSTLRAEHFLAQCLHETGGLHLLVESLNYSAQRLTEVWPSHFPTLEAAQPFAHNASALANKIYGGRMGNIGPDDGWRYIGRGLLQLTGREEYEKVGRLLSLDLVGYPATALDPENGLLVAGELWWSKQCNVFADGDSLERITRAINGGLTGLAERRSWLEKVRREHVVV